MISIFNTHKRGNYRDIGFCNSIAKVLSGVPTFYVYRRNDWLKRHDKLSEFQAEFREGYSMYDNIFCVKETMAHTGKKKSDFFFF